MVAPQRGSNTSPVLIEVVWATISSPYNGDSTITSYSLEWDVGSGGQTWVYEIGYLSTSLATTYSLTDNIISGNEY